MNKLIVNDMEALRLPCKRVTVGDGLQIGKQLLQFLQCFNREHYLQGVGLAAPQLGIYKRVCVLLKPTIVLINPEIICHSEEKVPISGEACLSFPEKQVNTYRWINVVVKADNLKEPKMFGPSNPSDWSKTKLLRSVAAQHEIQHLSGILIFDNTEQ